MRNLHGLVALSLAAAVAVPAALAAPLAPTTFVAVLSANDEVPPCAAADSSARGLAIFHIRDQATGTVEYRLNASRQELPVRQQG